MSSHSNAEENSAALAEFLESKSRLQEKMAGARREIAAMRSAAASEQRAFNALLTSVRKQMGALVESTSHSPPSLSESQASTHDPTEACDTKCSPVAK